MQKGNYSTTSHKTIMNYLENNQDKLVNVNDIDGFLKGEGIDVNVSTIYRYLNKLSNEGKVMKYVASKGEMSSFQYIGDEEHDCKQHLHLHCIKCGKIIHLECHFMDEISDHIMKHHGFSLQCESSVLYGICKTCGKED